MAWQIVLRTQKLPVQCTCFAEIWQAPLLGTGPLKMKMSIAGKNVCATEILQIRHLATGPVKMNATHRWQTPIKITAQT